MNKKKLKWADAEDIAFLLIDLYPQTDPMKLSLKEIERRASSLTDLKSGGKAKEEDLEEIQKIWFEERSDMEDELGPFEDEIDEELDEDDYRNDRMIDDDTDDFDTDDDDDDEDEFGDGFQEEADGDRA